MPQYWSREDLAYVNQPCPSEEYTGHLSTHRRRLKVIEEAQTLRHIENWVRSSFPPQSVHHLPYLTAYIPETRTNTPLHIRHAH
jgi:hypothetical protein